MHRPNNQTRLGYCDPTHPQLGRHHTQSTRYSIQRGIRRGTGAFEEAFKEANGGMLTPNAQRARGEIPRSDADQGPQAQGEAAE